MRKPLTVTLSVVCTLKGMSRQLIQRIKAMPLYMVCLSTLSIRRSKHGNALNAMFVETVNTLVFVALTQHLIQSTFRCENSTLLCIKWLLTPARREGYLLQYSIWKAFHLGGWAVHQSVWGGSFVTFLDLSTTRVIAGKMHSQSPILKLRGHSATQ